MEDLIKSLDDVAWTTPESGVKEKRLRVGSKVIRLLKINGTYKSDEWCLTGHTGYVLKGSFDLDINGEVSTLGEGSVFYVEGGKTEHRHIPFVPEDEAVHLLLIEESVEQAV